MPAQNGSVETEPTTPVVGAEPAPGETLTEAQVRALAEILYQMMLDELRIERERLGR